MSNEHSRDAIHRVSKSTCANTLGDAINRVSTMGAVTDAMNRVSTNRHNDATKIIDPLRFQNTYRVPTTRVTWHGYDGGTYFVTICTHDKKHDFGEIVGGDTAQMLLTEIGRIAERYFQTVTELYPYASIPLFVIMPNHIHAIVRIACGDDGARGGTTNGDATKTGGITGNNNPMRQKCLGTVLRGLKARISHDANERGIPFAWQSRFYDRIVRDADELTRIAAYIKNNIPNWSTDELNDTVETRFIASPSYGNKMIPTRAIQYNNFP